MPRFALAFALAISALLIALCLPHFGAVTTIGLHAQQVDTIVPPIRRIRPQVRPVNSLQAPAPVDVTNGGPIPATKAVAKSALRCASSQVLDLKKGTCIARPLLKKTVAKRRR